MEHEDNLIWVIGAKPIEDYFLELQFNNGRHGKFDCKPLIKSYALFKELENPDVFFNISLDGWTVTWANGTIDIAPEYLYDNMIGSYPIDHGAVDHMAESEA